MKYSEKILIKIDIINNTNMGWIEKRYQMVVALSLRLTVQIETPITVNPEIDGVVY